MILLDTHVVLWLGSDPRKLSKRAVQAIRRARSTGGLALSCVSLLEVAGLIFRKRIEISATLEDFVAELEQRFVILPLTGAVASAAVRLPVQFPADPMDRIIGATALVGGIGSSDRR